MEDTIQGRVAIAARELLTGLSGSISTKDLTDRLVPLVNLEMQQVLSALMKRAHLDLADCSTRGEVKTLYYDTPSRPWLWHAPQQPNDEHGGPLLVEVRALIRRMTGRQLAILRAEIGVV